ncbi:nuclear transport factor 2 family protein [Chitinophaga agri]|uniref:Nuclear transport factor 2 family protein n=1 Tax=Chitinophaga agri TaxID=2703787 RepID=A0A6B9ZNX0_9BACT|nr:nuclear transport factor 2 family protein [Chitinophaga agri]QHS62815.1 nuclear transport factor 2 family protein [Chitinophaga agri]
MEIKELALQLEHSRANAQATNDVQTLSALLSEDLYYGHSTGQGDSKSAYLSKVTARIFQYEEVTPHIVNVSTIGEDGLMIQGTVAIRGMINGNYKDMHSAYLAVWRREGAHWRMLGHQTALIS